MALRTLLATVDETIPVLPASTHREVKRNSCDKRKPLKGFSDRLKTR